MSRALVRQQIAEYLGGQLVPGQQYMYTGSPVTFLSTLYSSWVRVPWDEDFLPGVGTISGAIAVIHLPRSMERREAFGGEHSGKKRVDYTFALELYFLSRQDRSEDAMADFDTMVDSLIDRVRASRTFGVETPVSDGSIWQAGEGPVGIEVAHDAPDVHEGRFRVHAVCQLQVTTWATT